MTTIKRTRVNKKMDTCPNCGKHKQMSKHLCGLCNRFNRYRGIDVEDVTYLKSFIQRIENRNGWASMEEVFIELITLNNIFGHNKFIDELTPPKQLESMYKNLLKVSSEIQHFGFVSNIL